MTDDRPVGLVFVHTSDELYGADRVLLDILWALPPEHRDRSEVWFPTDIEHGSTPLCTEVEALGVRTRHLDLPILRRAYRTPRALLALAGRAGRLHAELRRVRPDVVYCTTSAALVAAPLARRAGVRVVVGHVQELWSRSDTQVLGLLARSCHRLLAISRPVQAALPARLQERTTIVPNATPAPIGAEPLVGRTGPLHFVVASRWNGWKGHRTLLAAWDLLDEPGQLTVLGDAPASGERVDVRELVAGLRHPGSVEVVGEVPGAAPHIEEADVLVVPSDRPEPFGLVAIEAFARGRPVVASDGGGLADIVTDGHDGWLFPLADVAALAERLGSLTRDQVTEAGAHAHATYLARYTAERFAADWNRALAGRLDAPRD